MIRRSNGATNLNALSAADTIPPARRRRALSIVVGIAQLVRAPDCDSGGRRFKSGYSPFPNKDPVMTYVMRGFLMLIRRGSVPSRYCFHRRRIANGLFERWAYGGRKIGSDVFPAENSAGRIEELSVLFDRPSTAGSWQGLHSIDPCELWR